MLDPDPKLVVLQFNDAINRRDLQALDSLMTDDHLFIDSANQRTQGRGAVRAAWSGFFSSFPDYENVIDTVLSRGDRVILLGHSRCSVPALTGPAIWTASVAGGRLAEWRVHEDDIGTRRELLLPLVSSMQAP